MAARLWFLKKLSPLNLQGPCLVDVFVLRAHKTNLVKNYTTQRVLCFVLVTYFKKEVSFEKN